MHKILIFLLFAFFFVTDLTAQGGKKTTSSTLIPEALKYKGVTFEVVDTDHDGKITFKEAEQRFGANFDLILEFYKLDKLKDASHSLNRFEYRVRKSPPFDVVDMDHDGKISTQEWNKTIAAIPNWEAEFFLLDTNNDKVVTKDEYGSVPQPRLTYEQSVVFKLFDKNGDYLIEIQDIDWGLRYEVEFGVDLEMVNTLANSDKDGDRFLDKLEFVSGFNRRILSPEANLMFKKFDKNHNDLLDAVDNNRNGLIDLSENEIQDFAINYGIDEHSIYILDKNRDNRVDKYEFSKKYK